MRQQALIKLLFGVITMFLISLEMYSNDVIKITETVNPKDPKEVYLIVEASNAALRKNMIHSFNEYSSLIVYEQAIDSECGVNSPFIVAKNKQGLKREDAGRDCLIGVGSCLLGVIIIQAIGTTSPYGYSGFYATAGDKYVEGPTACLVSSIWITGIVFGVKGIIELFKPKTKEQSDNIYLKTEDIIESAKLEKVNEKSIVITNNSMMEQRVIPYILTKIWL